MREVFMRFIHVTDTHFTHVQPEYRTDDYLASLFNKWGQVKAIAKREQATAILLSGDIFHIKKPSHIPIWFVGEVGRNLRNDLCCDLLCIPGNHDMKYNNVSMIHESPYGVLSGLGVFESVGLDGKTYQEGGTKVTVIGVPYSRSFNPQELNNVGTDDSVCLCMLHTYAADRRGDMFGDETVWAYDDFDMVGIDAFLFGHDHTNRGVHTVNGKIMSQPGGMSRGSVSVDDVIRDVSVSIIEVSGSEVSARVEALNYIPAEDCFDYDRHKRLKQESREIQEWVESLREEQWDVSDDTDSMLESVRSSCTSEVWGIIERYVQAAESVVDQGV